MRVPLAAAAVSALGLAAPASAAVAAPAAVTLTAADGAKVYGVWYRAAHPKATILLFHQAMSSSGEYATIAPRLAAAGYDALAIDQRSGGGLVGANRTVAARGRSDDYLAARPDLEAALAWGERRGAPVILWGSSYSAALVFLVAAAHPASVKAVLAFSPGEYLAPVRVRDASAKVRAPLFVTSASDPEEEAAAKRLIDASPAPVKRRYVPTAGVHGSSTLISAKNPRGAADNWTAVLDFLKSVAG